MTTEAPPKLKTWIEIEDGWVNHLGEMYIPHTALGELRDQTRDYLLTPNMAVDLPGLRDLAEIWYRRKYGDEQ